MSEKLELHSKHISTFFLFFVYFTIGVKRRRKFMNECLREQTLDEQGHTTQRLE